MKKALFIFLRTVTVLSTMIWSFYCLPIVCFGVGMYCDDCLGMDLWGILCIVAIAPLAGLFTAAMFGKQLPRLDLILSVLLPPVFFGAGYPITLLTYVNDSIVMQILSYLLGVLCIIGAVVASKYFISNARKVRVDQ